MKIQRYATLLAVLVFPVAVSSTQVPTSTRGVPTASQATLKAVSAAKAMKPWSGPVPRPGLQQIESALGEPSITLRYLALLQRHNHG